MVVTVLVLDAMFMVVLMPVPVMHVRHVRMLVHQRHVPVLVGVLALRHRVVDVIVVPVVVAMHVLVHQRLVRVLMGVGLTPDLFRFGASSLVNDCLMQLKKEATGRYRSEEEFSKD